MVKKPTYEELQRRVRKLERSESEFKKELAVLREDADRHRFLSENMGDIAWVLDKDLKTTYVSPSIKRVLGFTPEERKAQSLNEMLTPESLEKVMHVFSRELEREQDSNSDPDRFLTIEVEYYRKDKSTAWAENRIRALRNEKGEFNGVYGISRDITDRKQAELALQESQVKYAKIFNENPVAISLVNLETGCFLEVNRAFETITGFSKNDLVGKDMDDLDIIVDTTQDKKMNSEIKAVGSVPVDRVQYRKKDGDIGWGLLKGEVMEIKGKAHVLSMMIDISDQKSAEDDLEFQANLLSAVKQAVIVTDTDGKITYWNPFAEDLYLWPASEAMGRNIIDVTVPRLSKDQANEIMSRLSQGETWSGEFLVHNRDGKLFPVQVTDTPIFDEKNQILGIIGVSVDITKQKKIEEQLRQAQKMEAIGTLAGGIAHDFNNILASIIGFTELALDEVKPDTSMEDSLQEIYTAGKRAKDLVWQILTFARQTDEPTKPIQVEKIVHEVLKFMRSSIPTSIEIKRNIESNSLIMGNPTQIHQIIMNLCTNAAQAMDNSGGTLMVSLKDAVVSKRSDLYTAGLTNGNYVELKVSDTGTGMAEEVIGSIFEPYFTTKGPGEGTGMGLAVVQGIVEKSKGKITVESRVGQGTTFSVYLPVTKKREARQLYKAEDLPTGSERILLVDDEAPLAKMGSQILEKLGYTVTTRTSSMDALELFKARPDEFDLVITDMTMPNLTGNELTIELLAIKPDIPVILCTGYSKKISDETAADIGIKAFAYKPLVRADLAKTVRKVLDDEIED